jgi:hypothetical protein
VRASCFLLLPFLLIGCATAPHRGIVHYSPPSVAPAQRWVSNAQGHAKTAQAAVDKGDLVTAHNEIDALTDELLNAQTALTELEDKTSHQTDLLNSANDEKNKAIDLFDAERAKTKAIVHQRNRLFLALSAALVWIFRTPLLWLAKLAVGLISKL